MPGPSNIASTLTALVENFSLPAALFESGSSGIGNAKLMNAIRRGARAGAALPPLNDIIVSDKNVNFGPRFKFLSSSFAPALTFVTNGHSRFDLLLLYPRGHDSSERESRLFDDLGIGLGASPLIRAALTRAFKISSSRINILLTGEMGVGKSALARLIWRAGSDFTLPLTVINCEETTPEALIAKFKTAPGTILLKHVEFLLPAAQSRLLTANSSNRVILSSRSDAATLYESGILFPEFFKRYCEMDVELPPLREHPEDIEVIIKDLGDKLTVNNLLPIPSDYFTYQWPGNIRELKKALITRLRSGAWPKIESLACSQNNDDKFGENPNVPGEFSLDEALDNYERDLILKTLFACDGRKDKAAEKLNVNLRTFHRRCARLGI